MSQTRLVKLGNLASVVRSKNAGPYRITLDVLFERDDLYEAVSRSCALTAESLARLYGVDRSKISSFFEIPTARAFKATIYRPNAQCALGESDVYGAQQHAPLLDMMIPVPSGIKEYHDV
ncbi:DUF4387 domain-containing protein [Bradyrhizobium acaciae]|uniref:DUF4387 domain-containing protein n=1 Tax=Bradyrhizobium acaciae TaxID=2683706 RepID=UPI001E3606BA|nr:DUF4387 domain-containing protein [Bradyrhizobium acaciae]MCC8982870.1 DUF4387 domain-containing protein [Bradyrhizobium acaciae]